jgi:hypothetical protein
MEFSEKVVTTVQTLALVTGLACVVDHRSDYRSQYPFGHRKKMLKKIEEQELDMQRPCSLRRILAHFRRT